MKMKTILLILVTVLVGAGCHSPYLTAEQQQKFRASWITVVLKVEDQDGNPIAEAEALPNIVWAFGAAPHADSHGVIRMGAWTNCGITVFMDLNARRDEQISIPWKELDFLGTNRVVFRREN